MPQRLPVETPRTGQKRAVGHRAMGPIFAAAGRGAFGLPGSMPRPMVHCASRRRIDRWAGWCWPPVTVWLGAAPQGCQKLQEFGAVGLRHVRKGLTRRFGFAAVPKDGFGEAAGAPVMQIGFRARNLWCQTATPMPQSGAVRHSVPEARASGRLSARPGPISCSKRSL